MEINTTPLVETAPGGQHVTDVAIIGAGPVGLFAVFQCGMLGMACHVLDALEVAGGQCAALYPEKPIYDIPALPEISGRGLVDQLMAQAAPFNPAYHLGQQVKGLTQGADGGWRLQTEAGTEIIAKAVIIAAGVGAFQPKRPPLAGLAAFEGLSEGRGVHYAIHDVQAYRDKRVVIAGGGDSAIDWALVLAEVASMVHVVHRRDKFRAADNTVAELRRLADVGSIDLVIPYQLKCLSGVDGQLSEVVVADTAGNEKALPADVLLAFYGLSQALGPIAEWKLDIDAGRITVDPATSMSNLNGIFAVGDISSYPGKLKLILSGFAEAAGAAHAAYGLVFPDRHLKFEYSTTKGLPDAS
jgi:thioredoxin reductase (NADPH)